MPKKKNLGLLILTGFIILIVIGFWFYSYYKSKVPHIKNFPSTGIITGTYLPQPKAIHPFKFEDDTNQPFTNENLRGYWTFLFFGFTHCGDVCPTTLAELNKMYLQLQKILPPESLPQIVMISIDPEHDTTVQLRQYMQAFNPKFIGVKSSAETLAPLTKELGIYFSKNDQNNIVHSAQLYLFNPDGNWVAFFPYPHQGKQTGNEYLKLINYSADS